MLINDALRREIGREAVRFCRRCPSIEERVEAGQTVYACHSPQCRLWGFLRLLGLRPGMDFDAPLPEEVMRQEHAQEVRRFRGAMPSPATDHDWEADAQYHGLVPQDDVCSGRNVDVAVRGRPRA